ncbi:dihydrodipicolinate synthase family protein [Ornithinimicrobium cavernae]|uniref:dihydrodipicolinate synthase family protein n=1 Tax=Ornithinimicrobium cavernae TaxID=2666047 RepID=UPI000D68B3B7|nr:dihydrodipicolinate synthase family protein [Ornithinimicrobium cavernae]
MTPREALPGDLWSILATPFDADGALDHRSMRRQVDFVRAAGASGVVALGVFGEATSLSLEEHRAVVRTVAEAADGLPVVVGVGARSTAVAVEQAVNVVHALRDRAGPRALMVMIPSGEAMATVAHLTAVHEASGLPVVLQDYPASSGVRISPSGLAEVVRRCPFVCAIKAEAAPTAPAIAELLAAAGSSDVGAVPVFGGLGGVGLVDELSVGASGAMTGFSHPEGLRATLDAFNKGGFGAARQAWARWLPIAVFEAQAGISLALRKALLQRRGVLGQATVRPPAPGLPAAMSDLVDRHAASAMELLAPGAAARRTGVPTVEVTP